MTHGSTLTRPQEQEVAIKRNSTAVSPQDVSELPGQVDTSSSQDFHSPVSENQNIDVTVPVEVTLPTVNQAGNCTDHVSKETGKRLRFQEHSPSSSIASPLRKRSLNSLRPANSPLHQRKNARKTFPHKITPMLPTTNQPSSSGVQVKSFSFLPFMGSSAVQHNQRTEVWVEGFSGVAENVDSSSGICDSTAGGHDNLRPPNENGHFAEDEGEPGSRAADACRPNLNTLSAVEDSRFFNSNSRSWESSSTNDSSPAISEDQPVVVDINSENSGTEFELEGNMAGESSPAPHQFERSRTNSGTETNESMNALSSQEPSSFIREVSETSGTAVVTLENTVQVKTEPVDKCPPLSQPGLEVIPNGFVSGEGGPVGTQARVSSFATQSSSESCEQSARLLPAVGGASPSVSNATGPDSKTPLEDSICNICEKHFETTAALMRHKRTHSGERPFICHICGWGFNLSGNLNQHMAIHQKVKPFKCPYCGKTFARSNVLKAHVRCHTGERPFQCQVCGSNFVISHNLKKHLMIRHGIQASDRGEQLGGQSQSKRSPTGPSYQ